MKRAFEDKLRSAFATFPHEDARLAGEVRLLFSAHRDLLFDRPGRDGLELSRGWGKAVDLLLQAWLDTTPTGKGLALLALGGYGRGELNPRSDVDLLVLYPEKAGERAEEFTGPLLAFLWDLGFRVGHAARTTAECADAMEGDLPSATAMLEGRLVTGSKVLFRKYTDEVTRPWITRRGDSFIVKKIEEARARHRFYGDSVRICRPNVKESRGGLRDMHVAGWIGLALSGRKDFRAFREAGLLDEEGSRRLLDAYGWIHQIRNALHLLPDDPSDVLDPASARRIAGRLSVEAADGLLAEERLLRTYYRAATVLYRFLERVIRFQEGCEVEPSRPLNGTLIAVGDSAAPAGETEWTPEEALEAVVSSAEGGLRASPDLVDALARAVPAIDDGVRNAPEVSRRFLDLLRAPRAGTGLRALDRAGFLPEYLPEFGAVAGLIRDDPVHRYTVDEHTLRALEILDRIADGDGPSRSAFDRLERPDLLRLGLLLHDVGKSRGRGHVERGMAMVPDVARRLGLSDEEARYVRFLVEHHALLPELADRRTPSEGAETLSRTVPTREHLRALYLLSLADVDAAGPGALTGWREAQIRRLFEEARKSLSPKPEAPYLDRVVQAAGESCESEARLHLRGIGRRYALEVEPSRAVLHLDLIGRLRHRSAALVHVPANGYGEVWVALRDAPGVFATVAGVLTLAGLDINAAQVYTRRDGVAVDGFFVTKGDGAPPDDEGFWREVAEGLCAALEGRRDLGAEMDRHRSRYRPDPLEPPPGILPAITASNRISDLYSALEITAFDRPALLHDLATAITDRGFSIHQAVVATFRGVVSDVFYVAWPDGGRPGEDDLAPLLSDLKALVRDGERSS